MAETAALAKAPPIDRHREIAGLAGLYRAVYDAVAEAAATGKRCPTNGDLNKLANNGGRLLRELAEGGWFRIEVFGKGARLRIAHIRRGPAAGLSTAPLDTKAPPRLVLEAPPSLLDLMEA